MLASVLQEAGLKTGLYTSPHLIDFRERIKINGQQIPEDEVVEFVNAHQQIILDLKPSFFELTVAMAFNYFDSQKVDVAVIEVGMGGRLDSTNIITPLVSIITNIGFDHTQFLGETLPLIAAEKAGIIKRGIPVIIGEQHQETRPVFEAIAKENESPICFAEKRFTLLRSSIKDGYQHVSVKNEQSGTTLEVELDLLGFYQKKNIVTVMAAMQLLIPSFGIPKSDVVSGLSKVIINTGLQGRWQIVNEKPRVICDTGHNLEGITLVLEQLKKESFEKLHFIFGMVNDKDPEKILSILPKNAIYYFTRASIPRALNEQELFEKATQKCLSGTSYQYVQDAYHAAVEKATANDLIFVGGSTFVVADFLKIIPTSDI
jgi:dihydrofolate synthase/folylpolyglutamate synthase